MPKPGLFITLEGLDFSGKSSALSFVQDRKGGLLYDTTFSQEPGGTALGQEIRQRLVQDAHMMSALQKLDLFERDRAEHIRQVIEPTVQKGNALISDRYVGSTYAYQVGGDGLDFHYVDRRVQEMLREHPLAQPDLTIYFKVSPKIRQQRMALRKQDALDTYDTDFYQRVEEAYLKGVEASAKQVLILNADLSQEQVASDLYSAVQSFMMSKFNQ